MGALAARMSKTGKVASVNGLEGLPNVVAQVGGFRKGAKSVKPDIEVKVRRRVRWWRARTWPAR